MAGDLNLLVDLNTQQAAAQVEKLFNEFRLGSQEAGDQLNRLLKGSVEKKVRIRLEKDTNGIKQVKAELIEIQSAVDGITRAYNKANKTQPGSLTSLRQQVNEAKQARDSISLLGDTLDKVSKKQVLGNQINPAFVAAQQNVVDLEGKLKTLELATSSTFDKFKSSLGLDQFLRFGRGVQDLVTIFQSLGIAVSALTSPINQAANALARLQGFELAFKAIGAGAGGASIALSESSRIALGLGVSLDTVRNGFQKLSPVILNSGGTLNDVSSILESLSSRFAAFGLNADESRRVMNGVIQAFAKGKLQAEELTQQISEADPAFKTDLAKALLTAKDSLGDLGKQVDGTVAGLEGLVKKGALTSEVLIKVLPLLSKSSLLFGKLGTSAVSAVESFGKSGTTITQIRTQIDNLNQLNLERLAQLFSPVIKSFLLIQAVVTDFVTRISKLEVVSSIASAVSRLAEVVANLTQFLLNGVEGFIRILDVAGKFLNVIGRILGPIADFAGALGNVPGVLETIGLLLLARFIKPAKEAITSVAGLTSAINQFGKTGQLKIALPDDVASSFKEAAKVIKTSFSPVDISRPIEEGTARASSAASARLAELRAKFKDTAKDISTPISVPEPSSPKKLGISAKVLKEVQESKTSLLELFQLKGTLEKDLANIVDPSARRTLFTEEAGQQILEYSSRIDDLNDKIDQLTSGPDIDTKAVARATKEIEGLQDRIDGLQAKIDDSNFTPDIDAKQYRATERALSSVEKQIVNIQKVRQVDLKALVDDSDVVNAIKNTDLLRGLYQRKLELEANVKTDLDPSATLKELETVKRTIRAVGAIDIPVTTNAADTAKEVTLSRQAIQGITDKLLGSEDQIYQSFVKQKTALQEGLQLSKQRLDAARKGADIGMPVETARNIYQQQQQDLSAVTKLMDNYTASMRQILTAGSQADSILDGYNSKLLTQNQALGQLSQETAKYATFQSKIQQALGDTEARLASLNDQLSKAKEGLSGTSFNTKDADTAKANIAALEGAIAQTEGELTVLQGAASQADGELSKLGSTAKAIGDAEFRLGEKITNSLKPVQGAFDGISKGFQSALGKAQGTASGFAAKVSSLISQIKIDGFKGTLDKIGTAFANAGDKAKQGFGNTLSGLASQIQSIGQIDIKGGISKGFEAAKKTVGDFGSNAQRTIGTFAASTIKSIGGVATSVGSVITRTNATLKGIFTSLGPELAIFAAIAIATAAYNRSIETTKAINEEAAGTIDRLGKAGAGLKKSLAEISGEAEKSNLTTLNKEFSGLEKVLLTLGDALLAVQKFFAGLFDFLDAAPSKTGAATEGFSKLQRQLAIIVGFAAAGAAIGAWTGAGALITGALGAGIGAFVAATAGADDYGRAVEEARKEQEALVSSAGKTAQAVRKLANEVATAMAKAKELDAKATGPAKGVATDTAQAQGISAYQESDKAVKTLQGQISALKSNQAELSKILAERKKLTDRYNQIQDQFAQAASGGGNIKAGTSEYEALKKESSGLYKELEKNRSKFAAADQLSKEYNKTLAQLAVQEEIARLAAAQLAKSLGLTPKELEKISKTSFNGIQENVKNLEAQIKALNFDKSDQILRLSRQLGAAKVDLEVLDNIAKRGELEGYFKRATEQIANGRLASSLKTVNDLISNLKSQIDLLDFTKPEDLQRIDELSVRMGKLSAIVEVVENRVSSNKLAGYIEQVKQGLADGSIPDSLTQINNLVQALEQRQMLLDINSPELQSVTEDLVKAKQQVDVLNGKKAAITLQVIQEGIENGSIIRTLGVIDQQIEALNQKKLSLPVNSAGYVEVLDQIKTIERQRQLSEQTTDDLLERKYNLQKERIDAISALEKAKSDQRIALIDKEIDKVKTFYDEQIKALEKQKGPNELALEAVKLQDLQAKANQPGRDGLEARAELERMAREKEIARLKEEEEKKLAELEKKKKAETNAILDKELSVAEERLALEERITALRLRSIGAEEADINAILNQRGVGTTTGGTPEQYNQGKADGQSYGKGFNEAVQMEIRKATPNEQDPASKVKFNFDNTQVIAAQDQVIQKEQQMQDAVRETEALRVQANAAPANDPSVGPIVDQLLEKERQLAVVQNEQFAAQEQYAQTLRDTATITGDIVISNQGVAEQVNNSAQATEAMGNAAEQASSNFYDVNAAATGTSDAITQAADAAGQLGGATDDVNTKQQEIGEGVKKTAGSFEDLRNTVVSTGEDISNTGSAFDGATQKVNQGLVPALEKVPATLDAVQTKMNQIFDREYTVNVRLNVQKQGVWTGGPVTRGTSYTVNELGQEGFMNKFGNITPIQKPRWGTWRPPSDGFVIPADIYGQIKARDSFRAPRASVSHSSPNMSGSRKNNDGIRDLARMMAAVANRSNDSTDFSEMAKVQAHQAREIGKLSRAVQDLAEKDWNVKVGVRNNGSLNSMKLSSYRV